MKIKIKIETMEISKLLELLIKEIELVSKDEEND